MGSEILKTPERPKSNGMKEENHKPKYMLLKKGLLKKKSLVSTSFDL